MSQNLKLANFNAPNIIDSTELDADLAADSSSITVKNGNDFTSQYLLIGALGSSTAELLKNTSTSSGKTIGLVDNNVLTHNRFEKVYALFGNQLKIYRAPNTNGVQPDDDAFEVLDTVDIDPNSMQTSYTDATGGSDWWYKCTYFNQTTSAETPLAISAAGRGGGDNNYATLEAIRKQAGLNNNKWIADEDIDEARQAAQEEINATLVGTYTVPFTKPINPLIADITIKLAAGFLLTKNYGSLNSFTTNNGKAMIDEAREKLEKLNKKTLVLTDTTGASTVNESTAGDFNMWPNEDTATTNTNSGGGERGFRIGDRY